MGKKRPGRARPVLELLEDRTVLNSYAATTVADLIADINAANLAGGSNTITLAACKMFTLTQVDNTTNGGNGPPVIAAGNSLTIAGNGDTLARNLQPKTPAFRFFDLAAGASLTFQDLTLSNGLMVADAGMTASGGAVLNEAGGSLPAATRLSPPTRPLVVTAAVAPVAWESGAPSRTWVPPISTTTPSVPIKP
jgi:hypothetical protein